MRRVLAIGAVTGAVVAGLVLTGAGGGDDHVRYRIVLDNAFGLVEGGDFRVGGVRVGHTTDHEVVVERGEPPRAVVTAEVEKPEFADLREDATCEVRPQSLIGEYYLDCEPGNGKRLPTDGSGIVPVEHTASTIPVDVVNNILRKPYKDRLRIILSEFGAALAGRPEDLSEAIRRAHPGLRETSRVLAILGRQNRTIERFIRDADTVVAQLERRKADVTRFVREAGKAAQATANRRAELRRSLAQLPGFLAELEPTMTQLSQVAREQRPVLADVHAAASDLDEFVDRLEPFARETRPALRSLGRAARTGNKAISRSREEVRELRQLAADAPAAFKPLRQFLQTSDDRRRAPDQDSRAKVNGPPPTDRSYGGGRGGFTAMESLWNYFFWQTLAINGFDPVGHVLRVGITVNKCSPFQNIATIEEAEAGDPNFLEDCNQWLGPNQPGLTTEDFTTGAPPAFPDMDPRSRSASRDAGGERRERSAASEPGELRLEAQKPKPGQRDISKPQVVLPPSVQELAERIEDLVADERPRRGSAPTQLLDYLLAP